MIQERKVFNVYRRVKVSDDYYLCRWRCLKGNMRYDFRNRNGDFVKDSSDDDWNKYANDGNVEVETDGNAWIKIED